MPGYYRNYGNRYNGQMGRSYGGYGRRWGTASGYGAYRRTSSVVAPFGKARVSRAKARENGVKQLVKQVLAKEVEQKTRQTDVTLQNLGNPAGPTWATSNIINVGFGVAGLQVLQGVGDGQRVGNKIRPKRVMWNFVLNARPYDAANNTLPRAQNVRVVLFYDRDAPSATPNPITDFFQLNNSFDSISGNLSDIIAPINTNQYVALAERTFKVGWQEYIGNAGAGATVQGSNNDYKQNVIYKWDITKFIPKEVLFEDNSGNPTSKGLWACIMLASADGSTGASGQSQVQISYWLDAKYTDA